MDEFTDEQIVAIGTAIKDAPLKTSKGNLRDGSTANVDFKIRIRGSIQKGRSTPGGKVTAPAQVCLTDFPIVCALLRHLGIGATRLRAALTEIDPAKVQVDPSLAAIFDDVARVKASKLPDVETSTSGKAGAVQSQLSVELIK